MSSEVIPGLPISKKWLVELLKSTLNTDLEPVKITVNPIDKGFVSLVAQLKFEWPEHSDQPVPQSLVMKIPNVAKLVAGLATSGKDGTSVDLPFDSAMLDMVHNCECNLYRLFAMSPATKSPVTIGQIYAVKSEGHLSEIRYILMEDFVGRARCPDFITEPLSYGQVNAVVKEIASLQAYGITHPTWLVDNEFMKFEIEQWKSLPDAIKAMREAIRAQFPNVLTATDEQMDNIIDYAGALKAYEHYFNGKKSGVMTHGDLWSNNLLFEVDHQQVTDNLLAVIDWQCVHPGSNTDDLARLLTTSVAPELRRKCEMEWLQLYYKELGSKLPEGTQIPFSFQEVLDGWKESFAFALNNSILLVGLVLGKNTSTAKYTEEHKRKVVDRIQKCVEDCLPA